MLPAITQSVRDASTQIKQVIKTSAVISPSNTGHHGRQQQHYQNRVCSSQRNPPEHSPALPERTNQDGYASSDIRQYFPASLTA
jgi:hypothetical protein